MCGIHYFPLHLHKVYCDKTIYLPKSELDGNTTISIPFHEKLTTHNIKYIIQNLQKEKIVYKHE